MPTYLMVFNCPCFLGSGPPMRTVMCIPIASPTPSINGPKILGSESRTLEKRSALTQLRKEKKKKLLGVGWFE